MWQKLRNITVSIVSFHLLLASFVIGIENFKYDPTIISKSEQDFIQSITPLEWLDFTKRGIESNNQEKRLETNLVGSNIVVKNGSISHAQLLDALPNPEAQRDSEVADQILKASLYIYNSKCAPHGISGQHCETLLSDRELPSNSDLTKQCQEILRGRRNGHYPLRRLLPRHYKDGFNMMFTDMLPQPLDISHELSADSIKQKENILDTNQRNLVVVQWSQFVANDLSKPVVNTMSNGSPIECCNVQNYKLQPRQLHPACECLISKDNINRYGRDTCLSYVRSALAVGNRCTFGAPEQLNQATAELDLSQLYGFTENTQQRMRLHKDGKLKYTGLGAVQESLLPLVTKDPHMFCALNTVDRVNATCFMAGDSRVNENPFQILIYTIFMRNHNRIATELKDQYPSWPDQQLFENAKSINIAIYKSIVFNEWLPVILGTSMTNKIKISKNIEKAQQQISNEYAVAASRFYLSMMPNVLHNYAGDSVDSNQKPEALFSTSATGSDLFTLKDEIYAPNIEYTSKKLDDILYSILRQHAMKIDSSYVESLISDLTDNKRPTHSDLLAFDIQRSRDHGLQPYVKYLEICKNIHINNWKDLERFIAAEDLSKLQRIYSSWRDIDLIVGGISEISANDVTVGPTFQCIIGEQFENLRQWQQRESIEFNKTELDLTKWKTMTATDLLCLNSNLLHVPSNIFHVNSNKNPMLSCADRLKNIL